MPTLEVSRRQAKQVLRWFRAREYTVAEQIRAFVPRFAGLADRDIFAAAFKLADAQELIARKHGFANWQALKAGSEPMSDQTQPAAQPIFLQGVTPHLHVSDIDKACAWFEETLGFDTLFKYGDPPFFAIVKRDGVRLAVRCIDAPLGDPALRAREDILSADITVGSVRELKQLFAEFQAAGADIHQPLKKEPWGGHDFIVKDPDGNLLCFGCGD